LAQVVAVVATVHRVAAASVVLVEVEAEPPDCQAQDIKVLPVTIDKIELQTQQKVHPV
jgi:hypothetical protein